MRTLLSRTLFAALALLPGPPPLAAQGVSVGAARWLTSPRISEYRLGIDGLGSGGGAVTFRPMFQYLRQGGDSRSAWGGVGSDVLIRTTLAARPYLIAGAGLGLGRGTIDGGLGPAIGMWGGLGAELLTSGPIGVQAEALYTWRSKMDVRSVSLGLRAGLRVGRQGGGGARSSAASGIPRPATADEETIRKATGPVATSSLGQDVVGTALSAMGTPYRWGGTDLDGFDCSGLISYAYAQHGQTLPRRSVEQARTGTEVGRDLAALLPGDILTFAAEPGGEEVAHVGLYVGEGRFIHSATGGVQASALSADDPAAKWWMDRWVGARRVR